MQPEMMVLLVLTALGSTTISVLASLSANHQAAAVVEQGLRGGGPSNR